MLDRGVWPVRARIRPDAADAAARSRKRGMHEQASSPQEAEWPEGAIFTVGHSTLPIERFVALLHTYGIECLADIRTVPRSRHNPQFNGDTLADALKPENIEYVPLPALGGLRHARKDFLKPAGATQAFADTPITCRPRRSRGAGNADSHEPPETYCDHVRGSGAVALPPLAGGRCASVRGIPAVEILSESSYRMDKLTPFAQVEGTHITYPPEQATLPL